jgi:hypothetical protein
VRGYLHQRSELAEQRAALTALEARRDALGRQLVALRRPEVLEARARELGLVRPGERTFLIRGLPEPGEEPADASEDDGGGGGILGFIPNPF